MFLGLTPPAPHPLIRFRLYLSLTLLLVRLFSSQPRITPVILRSLVSSPRSSCAPRVHLGFVVGSLFLFCHCLNSPHLRDFGSGFLHVWQLYDELQPSQVEKKISFKFTSCVIHSAIQSEGKENYLSLATHCHRYFFSNKVSGCSTRRALTSALYRANQVIW